MSLSPPVMRRLMREITQLKNSPPEGIRVQTSEDNVLDLTGIIAGPEGTPYAGGYFKVKFHFTEEFPAAPPKCRLLTKIFHPNVSSAGEICVNTLKKDWNASFGIAHILVTVKCLLIYPNPESALDEEAGKLLLEDYSAYCSRARLITSVHATPRVRPAEFDVPAVGAEAEASTSTPSSSSVPNAKTTPTPPTSAPTFLPPPPTRKSASPAPPAIASSSLLPLPLPSLKSTSPPVSLSENAGAPLVGVPFPMPMPMALPFPVSKHTSSTPGTGPGTGTPLPLGTADANVALPVPAKDPKDAGNTASNGGKDGKEGSGGAGNGNTTKAVKRTLGGSTGPGAGTSGSGAEKRKKALKRL
ncbi:ubiquitin-conjugating enzyme/RWD-like protein [Mycena galericulata]|nr:ubiquitin-conjugating enzyme/RWD-like protein [Mycena galericulata]